jgi:threonyl-tRNA synthetase
MLLKELKDLLFKNGIRVELDDRDEKLGYRLRESVIRKIPLTLVIGDKERDNKTIAFRRYGSEETTTVSIDEFIKLVQEEVSQKK